MRIPPPPYILSLRQPQWLSFFVESNKFPSTSILLFLGFVQQKQQEKIKNFLFFFKKNTPHYTYSISHFTSFVHNFIQINQNLFILVYFRRIFHIIIVKLVNIFHI